MRHKCHLVDFSFGVGNFEWCFISSLSAISHSTPHSRVLNSVMLSFFFLSHVEVCLKGSSNTVPVLVNIYFKTLINCWVSCCFNLHTCNKLFTLWVNLNQEDINNYSSVESRSHLHVAYSAIRCYGLQPLIAVLYLQLSPLTVVHFPQLLGYFVPTLICVHLFL